MTFPEWMTQIERSGASVDGVDLNWLQQQYQTQQKPSLIAQMIVAGHAPRPMAQQQYVQPMPMVQPMMQPMYQPMYAPPKPRGGFSTFLNIFMGIIGFVGIIGAIVWGLMFFSKKVADEKKGPHMTIEGGTTIDDYQPPPIAELKKQGLDPDVPYPYWPIVYDMAGMKAAPDVIYGKLTNFGDKAVKNVVIHFGLYKQNGDKVGIATDTIAVLEPKATWEYRASVTHNYDQCRLDDITFSK